ncbi:hypothetical protein [Pontibacter diazotrophicus]|uniref:hypothetical protein n=1 Tax=Pontibacter diazotrophicus TaxID=1400979 RepID=UPI0015F1788A|nr:hypothetical protein [Pontibacter diazotrophicus]
MFSAQLPAPILFHPLKHHLSFIKAFVEHSTATPEAELKAALLTIGGSQLDLYTGPLSPLQIATEVLQYLQERHLQQSDVYQEFLNTAGTGYRLVPLSDGTDWVMRWGVVEGRYVHLHPARYARYTLRVKANVLKTAIAAVIAASRCAENAVMDTPFINQVRAEWLAMPPVKDLSLSEGLSSMIALIKDSATSVGGAV